jgi:hypothetical protein
VLLGNAFDLASVVLVVELVGARHCNNTRLC